MIKDSKTSFSQGDKRLMDHWPIYRCFRCMIRLRDLLDLFLGMKAEIMMGIRVQLRTASAMSFGLLGSYGLAHRHFGKRNLSVGRELSEKMMKYQAEKDVFMLLALCNLIEMHCHWNGLVSASSLICSTVPSAQCCLSLYPWTAHRLRIQPSPHRATTASLVSSLDVLKNGINLVPPVPTSS